jgi:hypothetical protein
MSEAPEFRKVETEGSFDGAIREIYPIHHRFSQDIPKPLEVKIKIITADYQFAEVYLDFSKSYITNTRGGAPKRYIDQALEMLESLGIGRDLSRLPELVGKKLSFYTKKNAKGYLNAYISKHEETKVSPADAKAMLDALMDDSKAAEVFPATANNEPDWV